MKAIRFALVFVMLATLAACEPQDFLTWATVVGVEEVQAGEEPEEFVQQDEDLRIPEVDWQVDLRLDDGQTVTLRQHGSRRYEPGERVRVIKKGEGELLL